MPNIKYQNVIPAKAGIQQLSLRGVQRRSNLVVIFVVVFLSLASLVFGARQVSADELLGQCFCYPYSSEIDKQSSVQDIEGLSAACQSTNVICDPESGQCISICDASTGSERCESILPGSSGTIAIRNKSAEDECNKRIRTFEEEQSKRIGEIEHLSGEATVGKFIPKCLTDTELSGACRSIDIFVILGINVANYLFAIIGALALLMFIYGGIMLIISEGNPERVKKGIDAMLAAVIGIIVVFSAYLLVSFLGDVVGLEQGFRLF